MADTQRTIAGLKAILPDNTNGEISPQDLRDFVESIKTGHAEIYVSTPALTDITTQSVYQKAEGATTLSTAPTVVNWSMPANNRLRYDGVANRLAKVSCTVTLTTSGDAKLISFRLAKNDTTQVDSQVQQYAVLASQQENVSLTGLFEVATNDYIELWVANETDTTDLTVTNISMDVISFAI